LKRTWWFVGLGVTGLVATVAYAVASQAPAIAAGGLLHPARTKAPTAAPGGCSDELFEGENRLALRGWRCATALPRRGTVVYLHGIADNRGSAVGAIRRLLPRGFDVVAYDGRAHGDSAGASCTYGYQEKRDLSCIVDRLPPGPIILVGSSLGAAIALQTAGIDSRITAVVAAETFSDLETIARERAPSFLTESTIQRAFHLAEEQGQFRIRDVSPANAARRITVPVLLLHGAADTDTPPSHSERVYTNLAGSKRLILVPAAHHNESLHQSWDEILKWIESTVDDPTVERAHTGQ
jgi:uncharacterized protein